MARYATLQARVTVHPSLDVDKEMGRLARTVSSWRGDGYRCHASYTTEGAVRVLSVHITLDREFPQPHHISGGIHDALAQLSNSRTRITMI